MRWRFTLIDRDGVSHLIDDPVGWDQTEITIKRDLDKHGVTFDYQGNDFEFTDVAMRIIKAEWEAYRTEGHLVLVIEETCDQGQSFEELYRGRLLFSSYDATCGNECSVRMRIETVSEVMTLWNRWDQKVDLQTAKSFDGVTALVPYSKLGAPVTLPSKGIFLYDRAENTIVNATPVDCGVNPPNPTLSGAFDEGMIMLAADKTQASEIGSFFVNAQPIHKTVRDNLQNLGGFPFPAVNLLSNPLHARHQINPLIADVLVNYHEGSTNYGIVGTCEVDINIQGKIRVQQGKVGDVYVALARLPDGKDGTSYNDYEWIWISEVYAQVYPIMATTGQEIVINKQYLNSNFQLRRKDRLYLFMNLYVERRRDQLGQPAYTIEYSPGTHVKIKALSYTAPTQCKLFLVNEALSRITEAITDNKIRAYSTYFGRTDSQPYQHAKDGCGGMEGITKGLFIRNQEDRIQGKPFSMNVSLKDMWEGLEPIHHIGVGIEEDTQRPGFKRLRVENWRYFYKPQVVLDCTGVTSIRKKCVESEHYSTFNFGYQKWEAEEYTGLDEFLTKRQYRSTLVQVKNEFSRLSKMIASGYAWEITRRKSGESKDWRYDNELFILCLNRRTEEEYGSFPISLGPSLMAFLTVYALPFWATVGNVLQLSFTDANGVPLPANNGLYTITGASVTGGLVQLTFSPNVPQPSLFAFVTVKKTGVNVLGVETGGISAPQNIIDPATIYNYRLSPVRNALRWLDKALSIYVKEDPLNKLLFMDGDGNYHASGRLATALCRWEGAAMAENVDLSSTLLEDPNRAQPLLRPERDEFEYPMSVKEFKRLLKNPLGRIAYSNDCEASLGWIDEIKYKPEEGTASFKLIPSYVVHPSELHLRQGLATENYEFILTEPDGQTILIE